MVAFFVRAEKDSAIYPENGEACDNEAERRRYGQYDLIFVDMRQQQILADEGRGNGKASQ